ncbi:YHS domain-containing (seleno)protein [Aestuariispira insulae]|nr:YHS domain-containing (seleno)protein [Aestuariispira insulae]
MLLIGASLHFCVVKPLMAADEINTGYFNDLALKGYDSTAYFSQGKAQSGDERISFEWKGAVWLFAREADRNLFAANPEAFAPQYGGYCSNQMSLGRLSDTDPHVWLIQDGKLYLFGHEAGRNRWEQTGIEAQIQAADRHWKAFIQNGKIE